MIELNANIAMPVLFSLIYGPAGYWRSRRAGMPTAPALASAAKATIGLAALSMLYGITLNAMQLRWNSLRGYGVGLLFGIAGLVLVLAFQARQRKDWQ